MPTISPTPQLAVRSEHIYVTFTGNYDPQGAVLPKLQRLRRQHIEIRDGALRRSARTRWDDVGSELAQVTNAVISAGWHPDFTGVLDRLSFTAEKLCRTVPSGSLGTRAAVLAFADELRSTANALTRPGPTVADPTVLFTETQRAISTELHPSASLVLTDTGPSNNLIRRFHYGSPWWLDVVLLRVGVGGLAGLLALIKRYSDIDLQMRLKRAQTRLQLNEALELVARFEDHRRQREQARPAGTSDRDGGLEGMSFFPFVPTDVTITDDEDETPEHGR
jgi:hypothetical protein